MIVEILNATNNHGLPILWSYDHDFFTSRGDVWVGVSGKPVTIAGLRKLNSIRCAELFLANPKPDEMDAACPGLNTAGGHSYAMEDGLLWDVLSRTVSLVGSRGTANPLHGNAVKAVCASGSSQSAIDPVSYIEAMTPRISGKPIFDGYMVGSGFGNQAALNQCGAATAAGDPRNVLLSRNGAIVATRSRTDFNYMRQAHLMDSDAVDDRYRHFEATGPAHVVVEQTTSAPDATDTRAAGGTTLVEEFARCQAGAKLSDFPGRSMPTVNAVDGRAPALDVPGATHARQTGTRA